MTSIYQIVFRYRLCVLLYTFPLSDDVPVRGDVLQEHAAVRWVLEFGCCCLDEIVCSLQHLRGARVVQGLQQTIARPTGLKPFNTNVA